MFKFKRNLYGAALLVLIFSAGAVAEPENIKPDNSKINQRDQSPNEVRAQDQGTSKVDIDLTRKIRRALLKHKSFSSDAKNLKIITIDRVVTLKGPVKSLSEKEQIEKLANRIAGKSRVINQIEIVQ
jgi:hyperosmotically inducible protein